MVEEAWTALDKDGSADHPLQPGAYEVEVTESRSEPSAPTVIDLHFTEWGWRTPEGSIYLDHHVAHLRCNRLGDLRFLRCRRTGDLP